MRGPCHPALEATTTPFKEISLSRMKDLLLKGLPPEQRGKGALVLLAIVGVLILAKPFNLIPDFLDELPQHTSQSSFNKDIINSNRY